MKIFFAPLLFFIVLTEAAALPSIPGCPLHDSCVRAFKQEQRQRQRDQRQRESPDAPGNDGELGGDGKTLTVKKPLGIILGFQIDAGDFNDKKNDYINLRPSLAYLNGFGNLDFFLNAFYTLALDDPGLSPVGKNGKLETLRRGGFELNAAYTFDASERLTLAPGLDNQTQFDFTPDVNSLSSNGKIVSYAVLEPSLRIGWDFDFGDLSVSGSFPFAYAGDMALDYTVSASFNALFGFGLALSSRFWNVWADRDSEYGRTNPDFQYGETELILNFWRGPFFASLTLTADGAFRQFSVEPYLSWRIKKTTLFAGLLFDNLGAANSDDAIRLHQIQGKRDVSGVIPSVGAKFRL